MVDTIPFMHHLVCIHHISSLSLEIKCYISKNWIRIWKETKNGCGRFKLVIVSPSQLQSLLRSALHMGWLLPDSENRAGAPRYFQLSCKLCHALIAFSINHYNCLREKLKNLAVSPIYIRFCIFECLNLPADTIERFRRWACSTMNNALPWEHLRVWTAAWSSSSHVAIADYL